MQVKMLKGLVKKVKRRFRKVTHVTRSSVSHPPTSTTSTPPSLSPFVDIVRDFVPPPVTVPASPRSRCSSDTFAKSEFAHHDQDLGIISIKGPNSSVSSSEQHSSESSATGSEDMIEGHVSPEDSIASHSSLGGVEIDDGAKQAVTIHNLGESSSHSPHITTLRQGEIIEDSRSTSPTQEVPMFTSPPTVYVEPEVPDPFLVDDPEDPMSDDDRDERPDMHISESQQTITPADEIPLTRSPSSPTTPTLLSPNRNKAVPPPPLSESDQEDEQPPELYLAGLVIPTMFLPIPNVRGSFSFQLTWWLSRSYMYYSRIRRIR